MSHKTEQEIAAMFATLPQPTEGSPFTVVKLEYVSMPHPYCIGPRHVETAAKHFSGILGEAAIEAAEKRGASCCICKGAYKYADHVSSLTLFLHVPDNRADLNKVDGLHAYLLQIKEANLGIEGFAFLDERSKAA